MKTIRTRIQRSLDNDAGFTLVEVVVAMFIFALISTGAIYTMVQILSITRDTRAREVAANLAAQEIDLARDTAELFDLLDDERTIVLNGDTFHVKRSTAWVSSTGTEAECGAGGGTLRYKSINITVKWDGMRAATNPVRSDTVLNPSERINDPALGTILVSVLKEAGAGSSSVVVTASPASPPHGAQTISETIKPTDAQGCTYVLKVQPGNYNVTIERFGYIDDKHGATATQIAGVVAGSSASVGFQFDEAAKLRLTYAANNSGTTPKFPRDLNASFINTYGTSVSASAAPATNGTITIDRYPFLSGYEVVAGRTVDCLAVDPVQWADGLRPPVVQSAPGITTDVPVPMGIFEVTGESGSRYVKAVAVDTAANGSPGCAAPSTYTFTRILSSGTSTKTRIALPYGHWKLYTGTSQPTQNAAVAQNRISLITPGSVDSGGILWLDPVTP